MERDAALRQLKFLYDRIQRTTQRQEHLPDALAAAVEPESLNYSQDLVRLQSEYNRIAWDAQAEGILSAAELAEQGLPDRF